jgi:hypothetical protein
VPEPRQGRTWRLARGWLTLTAEAAA